MTASPFSLPPGPRRRELMAARGMNVSDTDFTQAELAEMDARIAKRAAERETTPPRSIADLYRVES